MHQQTQNEHSIEIYRNSHEVNVLGFWVSFYSRRGQAEERSHVTNRCHPPLEGRLVHVGGAEEVASLLAEDLDCSDEEDDLPTSQADQHVAIGIATERSVTTRLQDSHSQS